MSRRSIRGFVAGVSRCRGSMVRVVAGACETSEEGGSRVVGAVVAAGCGWGESLGGVGAFCRRRVRDESLEQSGRRVVGSEAWGSKEQGRGGVSAFCRRVRDETGQDVRRVGAGV